jgi:UDP-glucose 4-epimerase
MSKCLVLGANGFLGSHLVDHLVGAGHDVRAFDRYPDDKARFEPSQKVEKVAGNFLNRQDLADALEGVEYVFHFISTTTPISSDNDPLIDVETNIRMSIELLQECVNKGVKKVVFASTGGAIYGLNSSENVGETIVPQPVSPYAIGKLTIEHYMRYFAKKHGLQGLVYRISNPYGERQSLAAKQGVIPIFLQHIAKDEPITILGDGSMVRDYIYVKDVARLITDSFESASQDLYNLGSGSGHTINQIVDVMKQVVGQDFKIEHRENLATFVDKIVLNPNRFIEEFNLRPEVSLEDGINATWQYVTGQLTL